MANSEALNAVFGQLLDDPTWRPIVELFIGRPAVSVHVAVMAEPYLSYILSGVKTVESRFSARRFAPYGRVHDGDMILFKAVSGPIVGAAIVASVRQFELDEESWKDAQSSSAALCADEAFWDARRNASFAVLMDLQTVRRLDPVRFHKRDRRGWVVLCERTQQLSLL